MFGRRGLFSRTFDAGIAGALARVLGAAGVAAGGAAVAAGALPMRADAQTSGTINRVLKSGVIRIATTGGSAPWNALNAGGQLEGYEIDMGSMVAKDLKVKLEWTTVDGPGRIAALQTGKADMTIANFTNTLQRSTVIAFSDPYVTTHNDFMVLSSRHDLQKVEDLNKPSIKIALGRGGTAYDEVPPVLPNAKLQVFTTSVDEFLALQSGQVDAVADDGFTIAAEMQRNPGKYRVPGSFAFEDICIGVPAGDFDWWRVVNVWVRGFNIQGTNVRLWKRWFKNIFPGVAAVK
jgi:polar amino acid transport system substrate-binding protein